MTRKLTYLISLIISIYSSHVVAENKATPEKKITKSTKNKKTNSSHVVAENKATTEKKITKSTKNKKTNKESAGFASSFNKIIEIVRKYAESGVSWRFLHEEEYDKMYDKSQIPPFIDASFQMQFATKDGKLEEFFAGAHKDLRRFNPLAEDNDLVPMFNFNVSCDLINLVSFACDNIISNLGGKTRLSKTNLYRQAVKFNLEAGKNQIIQDLLLNALQYFAYKKSLEICKTVKVLISKNIDHINAKKEAESGSSNFDLEEQEMIMRKFEASVSSYTKMLKSTKKHLQRANPRVNVEAFLLDIAPHFETMFKNAQSGCVTINESKIRRAPESAPEFKQMESKFIADWHRLPQNFVFARLNMQNAFIGVNIDLQSIWNFSQLPFRFFGDAAIKHTLLKVENEINKAMNDAYNSMENMNNGFCDYDHYKKLSKQKYRLWQSGGSRYELTIVDVRKTMIQAEQSRIEGIKAMLDALQNISKVQVVVGSLNNK